MKLISLHIENITSLREGDIDFTLAPLRDADIFLIAGEIGTGKSTILDCICLALYNSTPRLDNWQSAGKDLYEEEEISEKSPQQLLRRGATHGLVSLVFEDSEGIRYMVDWSVKRARNKPSGRIQDEKRSLQYTKNGKTYLITNKNELKKIIPEIVGLDFKQFCRTSMLAQGDFTRFLNSRDDEKASILEKITGTDIYSRIGAVIARRISEAESARNAIEAKIADTKTFTADEIREQEQLSSGLLAQRKVIGDQIERGRKILAVLSRYQTVNVSISEAHSKAKKYAEELETLKLDFEECRKVLRIKESKISELQDMTQKLWINRELYANANHVCQIVGNIIDTRKGITETSATIAKGRKELKELEEKMIKPAEALVEEKTKGLEKAVRNAAQINDKLDEMQPDRLRKQYTDLSDRKLHLTNCRNSISNLHTEIEERRKLRLEIDKQGAEMIARASQWDVEKRNRDAAETTYVQSQRLLETARQATEDTVKAVRSTLKLGDVCPVCDRHITSQLPNDRELEERLNPLQEAVEAAKVNLDKLSERVQESKVQILTLKESIRRAEMHLNDTSRLRVLLVKAQEDAVKGGLPESLTSAIDCEKTDLEVINYCDSRLAELDTRIEALKKEILAVKAQQESLKMANRKVETCREQLEAARLKLNQHIVKESSLRAELTLRRNVLKDNEANEKRYSQELQLELANAGYKGEIDSLQEFKERLSKESLSFFESEAKLKQLRAGYNADKNVADRCVALLERCGLAYPQEYMDPVTPEIGIGISELHERITTLITDVNIFCDELRANIKERCGLRIEICSKDIPDLHRLEDEISEGMIRVSEIDKQLGQIKEKLESNSRVCESISALMEQREQAEAKLRRWHRLTDLADMQGKRFKRIAQSYVLGSLVAVANDYLNRLSGRYRLTHAPGTFTLYVQDSWEGYIKRPASTISGGESFLVSLSLALALTDFAGSFHIDILFIDEGFGSLSGEALVKAVNVLRDLHSISGRRVGIISHIDSLKNDIPVQIRIYREGTSTESRLRLVPES